MRIHDLAYVHARRDQAKLYGKAFTPLDNDVAGAVLRAARAAMEDVEQDRRDISFRVVNAPTGTGKTTGSVAVAKAGMLDPIFSAAFVVETIRQVDELGRQLAEFIGAQHVKVWSSAHDLTNSDEKVTELEQEHGKLLAPRALKSELRNARIVVVTHRLWKGEIDRKQENGVRYYRGSRRSLVFVDEHPEIVNPIERQPSDFMRLRDLILRNNPKHAAAEKFRYLTEQAEAAIKGSGPAYMPAILLAAELIGNKGEWFEALGIDPRYLPSHILEHIDLTCRFLKASTRGCSFRSKVSVRRRAPCSR